MSGWEPFALSAMSGAVKSLGLAHDVMTRALQVMSEERAFLLAEAQVSLKRAVGGQPKGAITQAVVNELQKLGATALQAAGDTKQLARNVKLLALEEDASERQDVARDLGARLGSLLFRHAPLVAYLEGLANVQTRSAPKIGPGTVIAGRYELSNMLGKGGFGTVYRARHKDLGRDVALKLLNPEVADDDAAQKRFLKEVEATTSFVHKYAVQLREFGRAQDLNCMYFTMDLIEGRTLHQIIEEDGPLSPVRAVRMACQVLRVLDEAHAAGLVHRDLKPQNLIMTTGAGGAEEVRVLDFGIAKAVSSAQRDTSALTLSGMTVGTLSYMSPEQAEGGKLDGRSDIYSLGVVLFECLTGRRPVEPTPGAENTKQSFLTNLLVRAPLDLAQVAPHLPPELRAPVMTALAKRPEDRYSSARAFEKALASADLGSQGYPTTQPQPPAAPESSSFTASYEATMPSPTTPPSSGAYPAPAAGSGSYPAPSSGAHAAAPSQPSKMRPVFLALGGCLAVTMLSACCLVGVFFDVGGVHGLLPRAAQVALDRTSPEIKISGPEEGEIDAFKVVVAGTVHDRTLAKLTVDGTEVELAGGAEGSFERTITLRSLDPREIVVVARDEAGNETRATRTVRLRDPGPPAIEVERPAKAELSTVAGSLEVGGVCRGLPLKELRVNDHAARIDVRGPAEAGFVAEIDLPVGASKVVITARDAYGRSSNRALRVTRLPGYPGAASDTLALHDQALAKAPVAMAKLAQALASGDGVDINSGESRVWFVRAAKAGNDFALGTVHARGWGQARDEAKGIRHWRRAAEAGDPLGMAALGMAYSAGLGVSQSADKARSWLQKSAGAGYPHALYVIGQEYERGSGAFPRDLAKALEWYRKAEEAGSPAARVKLGDVHLQYKHAGSYFGGRRPRSRSKALEWYRKGAAGKDPIAMRRLAELYLMPEGRDTGKALDWLRRAAKAGDSTAMRRLGELYLGGILVERDVRQGKDWYLKAIAQRDPTACSELGRAYRYGKGVPADPKLEEEYYGKYRAEHRRRAEYGNLSSMTTLASSYRYGPGPTDRAEGVRWYQKAAAAGDSYAMYQVGRALVRGEDIAQDVTKGMEWYRKAAELGNLSAMSELARLYEDGLLVPVDARKAQDWQRRRREEYQRQGERGSGWALYNLARIYLRGDAVARDPLKAVQLLERAAKLEHTSAMSELGRLYRTGNGVGKDSHKAIAWYKRSGEAGNTYGWSEAASIYERDLRDYAQGRACRAKELEALRGAGERGAGYTLTSVARRYMRGTLGAPRDPSKGADLYLRAAELGNTSGMRELGNAYLNGTGRPRDLTKALLWFKRAGEWGDTYTAMSVARLYRYGRSGVPKDINRAIEVLERAANQGNTGAMSDLYSLYRYGREVPRDTARSQAWAKKYVEFYEKLAQGGGGWEMLTLARLYRYGGMVSKDYSRAFGWYEKAAKRGNTSAMRYVGEAYLSGSLGRSKDPTQAYTWYRRAAVLGDSSSMVQLAVMHRDGNGTARDAQESAKWYLLAARYGNLPAMRNVGELYLVGEGVARDPAKAILWLQRAADKRDLTAMRRLYVLYSEGTDGLPANLTQARLLHGRILERYLASARRGYSYEMVKLAEFYLEGSLKNPTQAVYWYRKAADKRNTKAIVALADLYWEGTHVPRNYADAVNYYRKAALRSNGIAAKQLGYAYLWGRGVTKDATTADSWFRKARTYLARSARWNDVQSLVHLGYLHFNGQGGTRNYDEAMRLFKQGAAKGDGECLNNVGVMYLRGLGVTKDVAEGARWYKKAVAKGYALSMSNLGFCYRDGLGVPKDLRMALRYFRMALAKKEYRAKAAIEKILKENPHLR